MQPEVAVVAMATNAWMKSRLTEKFVSFGRVLFALSIGKCPPFHLEFRNERCHDTNAKDNDRCRRVIR